MQAAVEIADALAQVANPADASPMAAYMQQIAPFLGVRAVARRAVVRQWCRQNPMASQSAVLALAQALQQQPMRECHYAAADVCAYFMKLLDASFITNHAQALLLQVPWWDTVDLWGSDVINPLCQWVDCTATMWQWNQSTDRWLIRAAIQHQRGRVVGYDVELALALCRPHVADGEFFVAKAIGWALRDMAKHYPQQVRQFLTTYPNLSRVAQREAQRGLARSAL